jgi:hypothetical protein
LEKFGRFALAIPITAHWPMSKATQLIGFGLARMMNTSGSFLVDDEFDLTRSEQWKVLPCLPAVEGVKVLP